MLFICSGEFIISLIPEGDLIKMHEHIYFSFY